MSNSQGAAYHRSRTADLEERTLHSMYNLAGRRSLGTKIRYRRTTDIRPLFFILDRPKKRVDVAGLCSGGFPRAPGLRPSRGRTTATSVSFARVSVAISLTSVVAVPLSFTRRPSRLFAHTVRGRDIILRAGTVFTLLRPSDFRPL